VTGPDRAGQPIAGNLEDVVVGDVLQFIQLGKRTGTLILRRHRETAMVGFHRGHIVAVSAPRTLRVASALTAAGMIDDRSLDELRAFAAREQDPHRLRAALLARGTVDEQALKSAITAQLEQGVAEVLRWETGSFEFVVDDLSRIDDLVLAAEAEPSEAQPDARSVIIEATRIFDARNRRSAAAASVTTPATRPATPPPAKTTTSAPMHAAPGSTLELAESDLREAVDALAAADPQPAGEMLELQVVSDDRGLVDRLRDALEGELGRVTSGPIQRAGEAAIGAPPPIVLIDVRSGGAPVEALAAVRAARPFASVVAMAEPGADFGRYYAAGALAAVPAAAEAVVACVENIIANRRDLVRSGGRPAPEPGVARLRRMMDDLRSGVMSASMALNLMQVISESVERAILFLVKPDQLAVLGAFGHDSGGRLLAASTRGMRVPLASENILVDAVRRGTVVASAFDAANLPEPLERLLGRPSNGTAVVFPVLGARRVIAAVYADNGERPEPVQDIEILELATVQVGIAFENELLRRRLTGMPR
jgi:Domain of unknown function (DUF4388)